MNWWMLADGACIVILGISGIVNITTIRRYADMAWEMDKALTDVEARLAKLENDR